MQQQLLLPAARSTRCGSRDGEEEVGRGAPGRSDRRGDGAWLRGGGGARGGGRGEKALGERWGSVLHGRIFSPWLDAASRGRARDMGSSEEVGIGRWVRAMRRWREDEGDGDRAEGRLGLGSGVAGPWA